MVVVLPSAYFVKPEAKVLTGLYVLAGYDARV